MLWYFFITIDWIWIYDDLVKLAVVVDVEGDDAGDCVGGVLVLEVDEEEGIFDVVG